MDDQEFDIRRVLGLLRRQLRLIIVTVVVVLCVATVAIFALKPVYTASALILVDTSRKDLLDPEQQQAAASTDSARVDSEVELVKSETTLMHVVDDAKLITDPEFGVQIGLRAQLLSTLRIAEPAPPSAEEAVQSVLAKLRDAVTVQRRGLTYLIAVQAKSVKPATAALIANAVANAYIRNQIQSKVDGIQASRDIIQGRIADASAAVAASEDALDTFISTNIDTIATDTGRADIASLRNQVETANADRARLMAAADITDKSLATKDWEGVAQSLQSQAVTELEKQRKALADSLTGAPEGSQKAIDLRAQLTAIEANLGTQAQSDLTKLRQQISDSQAKATDLRTQLRTNVLASNLPTGILTGIYGLQQNAEIARNQYQALLARQKDFDAKSYLQVADSRIVSEATPPNEPSFPNPKLILSLAGLAALGLGVGLAFLYENFIGGFTSEGQLESVLKVPVIAAVPRQRPGKKGADTVGQISVADAIPEHPLSIFAEAVRRARNGVGQALRRSGKEKTPGKGTVVMVTSAAPNEGKTTMALSLARAYAGSGLATLLIDCDLRKPSIHRQLGLEPSTGLLEYLQSPTGASLKSIVVADPKSAAQIALGARRSDTATDQLVTGQAFSRLLQAARDAFEIVILDTPPVGPVVDGLYLAPQADVIVFVARWANTSQQDAKAAVAALTEAKNVGTEVLAVLNQQDGSKASYKYRYAGYYSEA